MDNYTFQTLVFEILSQYHSSPVVQRIQSVYDDRFMILPEKPTGRSPSLAQHVELIDSIDQQILSLLEISYDPITVDINARFQDHPFSGASILMALCQYQCIRSITWCLNNVPVDLTLTNLRQPLISTLYYAIIPVHYSVYTIPIIKMLLSAQTSVNIYGSLLFFFDSIRESTTIAPHYQITELILQQPYYNHYFHHFLTRSNQVRAIERSFDAHVSTSLPANETKPTRNPLQILHLPPSDRCQPPTQTAMTTGMEMTLFRSILQRSFIFQHTYEFKNEHFMDIFILLIQKSYFTYKYRSDDPYFIPLLCSLLTRRPPIPLIIELFRRIREENYNVVHVDKTELLPQAGGVSPFQLPHNASRRGYPSPSPTPASQFSPLAPGTKPVVYVTKPITSIEDLCEFFTQNRPVSLYNTASFDILYEVLLKNAFPFDVHSQLILRLIITMYGPPSPERVTRFINNPSGYVHYNMLFLGQYLHYSKRIFPSSVDLSGFYSHDLFGMLELLFTMTNPQHYNSHFPHFVNDPRPRVKALPEQKSQQFPPLFHNRLYKEPIPLVINPVYDKHPEIFFRMVGLLPSIILSLPTDQYQQIRQITILQTYSVLLKETNLLPPGVFQQLGIAVLESVLLNRDLTDDDAVEKIVALVDCLFEIIPTFPLLLPSNLLSHPLTLPSHLSFYLTQCNHSDDVSLLKWFHIVKYFFTTTPTNQQVMLSQAHQVIQQLLLVEPYFSRELHYVFSSLLDLQVDGVSLKEYYLHKIPDQLMQYQSQILGKQNTSSEALSHGIGIASNADSISMKKLLQQQPDSGPSAPVSPSFDMHQAASPPHKSSSNAHPMDEIPLESMFGSYFSYSALNPCVSSALHRSSSPSYICPSSTPAEPIPFVPSQVYNNNVARFGVASLPNYEVHYRSRHFLTAFGVYIITFYLDSILSAHLARPAGDISTSKLSRKGRRTSMKIAGDNMPHAGSLDYNFTIPNEPPAGNSMVSPLPSHAHDANRTSSKLSRKDRMFRWFGFDSHPSPTTTSGPGGDRVPTITTDESAAAISKSLPNTISGSSSSLQKQRHSSSTLVSPYVEISIRDDHVFHHHPYYEDIRPYTRIVFCNTGSSPSQLQPLPELAENQTDVSCSEEGGNEPPSRQPPVQTPRNYRYLQLMPSDSPLLRGVMSHFDSLPIQQEHYASLVFMCGFPAHLFDHGSFHAWQCLRLHYLTSLSKTAVDPTGEGGKTMLGSSHGSKPSSESSNSQHRLLSSQSQTSVHHSIHSSDTQRSASDVQAIDPIPHSESDVPSSSASGQSEDDEFIQKKISESILALKPIYTHILLNIFCADTFATFNPTMFFLEELLNDSVSVARGATNDERANNQVLIHDHQYYIIRRPSSEPHAALSETNHPEHRVQCLPYPVYLVASTDEANRFARVVNNQDLPPQLPLERRFPPETNTVLDIHQKTDVQQQQHHAYGQISIDTLQFSLDLRDYFMASPSIANHSGVASGSPHTQFSQLYGPIHGLFGYKVTDALSLEERMRQYQLMQLFNIYGLPIFNLVPQYPPNLPPLVELFDTTTLQGEKDGNTSLKTGSQYFDSISPSGETEFIYEVDPSQSDRAMAQLQSSGKHDTQQTRHRNNSIISPPAAWQSRQDTITTAYLPKPRPRVFLDQPPFRIHLPLDNYVTHTVHINHAVVDLLLEQREIHALHHLQKQRNDPNFPTLLKESNPLASSQTTSQVRHDYFGSFYQINNSSFSSPDKAIPFQVFNYHVIDVIDHIQRQFSHLLHLSLCLQGSDDGICTTTLLSSQDAEFHQRPVPFIPPVPLSSQALPLLVSPKQQSIWYLTLLHAITFCHPFTPFTSQDANMLTFLIGRSMLEYITALQCPELLRLYVNDPKGFIYSNELANHPILNECPPHRHFSSITQLFLSRHNISHVFARFFALPPTPHGLLVFSLLLHSRLISPVLSSPLQLSAAHANAQPPHEPQTLLGVFHQCIRYIDHGDSSLKLHGISSPVEPQDAIVSQHSPSNQPSSAQTHSAKGHLTHTFPSSQRRVMTPLDIEMSLVILEALFPKISTDLHIRSRLTRLAPQITGLYSRSPPPILCASSQQSSPITDVSSPTRAGVCQNALQILFSGPSSYLVHVTPFVHGMFQLLITFGYATPATFTPELDALCTYCPLNRPMWPYTVAAPLPVIDNGSPVHDGFQLIFPLQPLLPSTPLPYTILKDITFALLLIKQQSAIPETCRTPSSDSLLHTLIPLLDNQSYTTLANHLDIFFSILLPWYATSQSPTMPITQTTVQFPAAHQVYSHYQLEWRDTQLVDWYTAAVSKDTTTLASHSPSDQLPHMFPVPSSLPNRVFNQNDMKMLLRLLGVGIRVVHLPKLLSSSAYRKFQVNQDQWEQSAWLYSHHDALADNSAVDGADAATEMCIGSPQGQVFHIHDFAESLQPYLLFLYSQFTPICASMLYNSSLFSEENVRPVIHSITDLLSQQFHDMVASLLFYASFQILTFPVPGQPHQSTIPLASSQQAAGQAPGLVFSLSQMRSQSVVLSLLYHPSNVVRQAVFGFEHPHQCIAFLQRHGLFHCDALLFAVLFARFYETSHVTSVHDDQQQLNISPSEPPSPSPFSSSILQSLDDLSCTYSSSFNSNITDSSLDPRPATPNASTQGLLWYIINTVYNPHPLDIALLVYGYPFPTSLLGDLRELIAPSTTSPQESDASGVPDTDARKSVPSLAASPAAYCIDLLLNHNTDLMAWVGSSGAGTPTAVGDYMDFNILPITPMHVNNRQETVLMHAVLRQWSELSLIFLAYSCVALHQVDLFQTVDSDARPVQVYVKYCQTSKMAPGFLFFLNALNRTATQHEGASD